MLARRLRPWLSAALRLRICRLINQHTSLILQAAWKQPADSEPNWYYDLDEVVYQALRHDVSAPVLALTKLAEGARSVLTRPEADVYSGDELIAEVDLWAVINGKVIVGEAKTVERLDRTAGRQRRAAARLARVAQAVTADQVVLATTATTWNETTVELMEQALEHIGIPLRLVVALGVDSSDTA